VLPGDRDLAADDLPAEVTLVDLGSHRLKDLGRPEQVFEVRTLVADGFPATASLDAVPNNLRCSSPRYRAERNWFEIRRLLRGTACDAHRRRRVRQDPAGRGLAAGLPPSTRTARGGSTWLRSPTAPGGRDVLTALGCRFAAGRPALQQ